MLIKQILAFTLGVALVVMIGVLVRYWPGESAPHPALPNELASFEFAERGQALPQTTFQNEAGDTLRVGDFSGKVLVVNLWATWCAPCVEELPTLDLLKRDMMGEAVDVLAISLDAEGPQVVRTFYDKNGIGHLDLLNDATMALYTEVAALGLPITLIVLPDGTVLGRLTGTARWDAPAVQGFLLGLAEN
ncbi:MAG: TlpA family protein disulfide reductase [Alphaproteobacteria bacterium]|nr:MAG: TlpA family protein disulfide reductase [Alphaproteobacteria bacterium]